MKAVSNDWVVIYLAEKLRLLHVDWGWGMFVRIELGRICQRIAAEGVTCWRH